MKTKILVLLFTFSVGVGTLYSQTVISVGANLSWSLSNGTLTISGNGAMNDFNYSTNKPSTTKESPWYSARASIKRVVINSGVTSIGSSAFYDCSGLTSITIPNSVTSIGNRAFSGCSSLTSVTIPNSVTSIIGEDAFCNCTSLTSVTIGNSVTSIGYQAFAGCSSLTSVTIPNSVTSIGDYAFRGCSGLTSVTIGNSVTSIGFQAFFGCGSLTSVTIPNSVTSIDDYAFSWCSGLTSVTIGNSVTSIGERAFNRCSGLTGELVIPNSVTSIGDYAFAICSGLTSVTIPNSVTSIGFGAFEYCSGLTSVTIPNSVTSIGECVFSDCTGLTSVTIPNSVTSIGGSAFAGCSSLTSVTIPNSVTSIGQGAFAGCSGLTSLTIGSSVTSIGYQAFTGCSSLTSVTIPNSVTEIDWYAFQNCTGLTSVTIPNSVTSIGDYAFSGCTGLTSVTIPNSVTSIGGSAFAGCSSLTSVVWNAKNCSNSGNFGSQVTSFTFGEEVEVIPASICAGMTNLTSITIPSSVTSIGNNAFDGCSGLTSIEIPNSVTSIGDYAFQNCSSLTSVTIGNSVTSIGSMAFAGCSGLTSVIWNAKNCADIASYYNTPFYADDYVPEMHQFIRFDLRPQITSFTFGNEVEHIPAYLCNGMSNLTSIEIPNSVTSIGGSAFYNCTGLTSVTCLATTPPACTYFYLSQMAFAGVDCSNIPLYVPIESVSLYQVARQWKEFNVIGVMLADEVETAVFAATPTDDFGVILEWQAIENATLYNIEIKQGNNIVRQLQFDSNGKLLNSPSNAPSRYPNIRYTSTAVHSGNGWRYELNDLDPGTSYIYSITVKAENGSVLYSQSIGFTTKEETFIIKFVNWNGEELLVLPEVVKGTTPSYTGETPVRPNTAEYTYTFAGWTPAVVAVTGDATYKATFTATKNSYTITWQNEDGSLIDQTTIEYGVVPTHVEPTKEATAEYTYTFAGWTPAVVAVTGDATYKATFNSVVNVYTISVSAANGQVIGGGEYQYGATIDLTAIPNEGYVFDQWSDGVTDNPRTITVTGDAEYTALFKSAEGLENIYAPEPVQKVMIDQKVYILRGEKEYTLQGQEVK